eukprot:scaffold833_cov92-Cylindrotheca_fusiformis.AAC.6
MVLRNQKDTWNQRLKELKLYKEKHGDCNVPLHFQDNKQLGRWVDKQRTYYKHRQEGKKSSMSDERISKLEDLGFAWKIREADKVPWDLRISELKQYIELHGDCNVPYHYSKNKALGKWVSRQREFYKFKLAGLRSSLTDERVKELEDIGFAWKVRDRTDYVPWEQRIKELKAYKEKHGDCNVPKEYAQNKNLGKWMDQQKTFYSLKKSGQPSPLTTERMKELEAIGLSLEILEDADHAASNEYTNSLEANWNTRLEELKKYSQQHGDCMVPKRYSENVALGYWVNTQRKHYKLRKEGKRSTMTEDRIAALEKIGFAWNKNEAIWHQRIEELAKYRDEHGNCDVPRNYPPNMDLAKWVESQRKQYHLRKDGKKSSMTDARTAELERVGLSWRRRRQTFDSKTA